jgi:hypothetical protein
MATTFWPNVAACAGRRITDLYLGCFVEGQFLLYNGFTIFQSYGGMCGAAGGSGRPA